MRPPNNGEELDGVDLGRCLRIDVRPARGNDWSMEFKRKNAPPLYWVPKRRALVIPIAKPKRKTPIEPNFLRREFEKWHASEPDGARAEMYEIKNRWAKIGQVLRIDYHSQKWGDDAEYTHDLTHGTYAWGLGDQIFWISGRLSVSPRGLIK